MRELVENSASSDERGHQVDFVHANKEVDEANDVLVVQRFQHRGFIDGIPTLERREISQIERLDGERRLVRAHSPPRDADRTECTAPHLFEEFVLLGEPRVCPSLICQL